MSKINNWFLQPNMQTDGLITEIKSDDYDINNNYVNLLERKINPIFATQCTYCLLSLHVALKKRKSASEEIRRLFYCGLFPENSKQSITQELSKQSGCFDIDETHCTIACMYSYMLG